MSTTILTGAKSISAGSLDEDQTRFYAENGYLLLEGLLDEGDLHPARLAMMQKVEELAEELVADGLIDHPFSGEPFETRLARLFENLDESEFIRYGRSWRDRFPGYFVLMSNPKILDAVESLIGGEIFANPVYNVRPKVPKVAAGIVPWHQDKSYWPDANSNPVITVWIPFVDSTPENGCLQLIPGTHRRRAIKHGEESYSGTAYLELPPRFVDEYKKEIITLPMAAGSALLFNDRLIHSSTANNSNHVRWSADLRYQPVDQDPMPQHGVGFLARSYTFPERVATLQDWLAFRPERTSDS